MAMTPSEQRAVTDRLAEAMGWTKKYDNYYGMLWMDADGQCVVRVGDWSPFDSLDDCRVVEDWIEKQGLLGKYRLELSHICVCCSVPFIFRATAAQRAEACLRVIEGTAAVPDDRRRGDGGGL